MICINRIIPISPTGGHHWEFTTRRRRRRRRRTIKKRLLKLQSESRSRWSRRRRRRRRRVLEKEPKRTGKREKGRESKNVVCCSSAAAVMNASTPTTFELQLVNDPLWCGPPVKKKTKKKKLGNLSVKTTYSVLPSFWLGFSWVVPSFHSIKYSFTGFLPSFFHPAFTWFHLVLRGFA